MEDKMWNHGDIITAEKLNRMQELAAGAHDEAVRAQIAELKLLCDKTGKMWGAELCSPDGIKTTVPCVTVTMQPITFTPTGGGTTAP